MKKMKYTIEEEKTVFQDHYKIVSATVTYDSFEGGQITARRLAFERGDSVAILLRERETDTFLLTRQFRYPSCKHSNGWLLEIPAGCLEEGESPKACIIREVMEELGYTIKNPQAVKTFYTSPGGATERVHLFFSEVSQNDKTGTGGGQKDEKEDIQLVKIPVSEIETHLDQLKDAKTILALQWFLLR